MRSAAVITLAMAAVAPAAARTAAVAADTTLDRRIDTLSFHFRVRPAGHGTASATLRWNVTAAGDCDYARFVCDANAGREEWDNAATVEIVRHNHGRDSIIARHHYRLDSDPFDTGFSLRLDAGEGGAALTVGADSPAGVIPVDLSTAPGNRFIALAGTDDRILRCDFSASTVPAPLMSEFASVDSLVAAIAASADPCENIWRHYDSDTDPLAARPGGHYTLATVAAADGAYDIIMIDGSATFAPLQIKGRLRPTAFPGLFDLDWLDDSGRPLGPDTADAAVAGGLLTLRFPYWKATIRFAPIR